MLGGILILIGGALMAFGAVMLAGWTGGKSHWFGSDVYDRAGNTQSDWVFLDLYFVAKVLFPLFVGAGMVVYGLRRLL
jgi:hypothetical protein